MPKDDIDPDAARRLAWTFATDPRQLETALDEKPQGGSPAPTASDLAATARYRENARRGALALMTQLAELQTRPLTAAGVTAFVRQADELGLMLHALEPDDTLLLANFLLAHLSLLEPDDARKACSVAAHFASVDSQDFPAWLMAVIHSGDDELCQGQAYSLDAADAPLAGMPRRLGHDLTAALVNPAVSEDGRILAIHALGCGDWRPDRDALLVALRDESWVLRQCALDALFVEDLLRPEDVELLLREAIASELPDKYDLDDRFNPFDFEDTLREAVAALKPPGAEALLVELVGHEDNLGALLDSRWALGALAAAFPATALPLVDGRLSDFGSWRRLEAVNVLAHLPLDLALPRLKLAAKDPVPTIARAALDLHLDRAGSSIAIEPLELLPKGLLQGPPSESLLRRLALLREPPLESRLKLRDLLMKEIDAGERSPETALLLLTLLCDAQLQEPPPRVEGESARFTSWMLALRPLLGPVLGFGLLSLAERFRTDGYDAPLAALVAMHRKGQLTPEELAGARRCALEGLDPGNERRDFWARSALSALGAPTDAWEELYPSVMEGDSQVIGALAIIPACPALDARINADLALDLPSAEALALTELGLRRKLPEAIRRGLSAVRGATTRDEVYAVARVMRPLLDSGAIERGELLAELSRPNEWRALLGLWALPPAAQMDDALRATLDRCLDGLPQLAEGVIFTLVLTRAVPFEDPRLTRVLSRMERDARASVLLVLLTLGADPASFAPQLLEVLMEGPPDKRESLSYVLGESEAGRALLEKAGISVEAEG